jgi:hypothetical protein
LSANSTCARSASDSVQLQPSSIHARVTGDVHTTHTPQRLLILLAVIAIGSTACTRSTQSAAPAPAPSTGLRVERTSRVLVRDSGGRVVPNGSSIDRAGNDQIEAVNRHVRVLRVTPDRLLARVGDTLMLSLALDVSGEDSTSATIPRVIPLFGPLPKNDVIRWLGSGRILATQPGRAIIPVRVMRTAQQPSDAAEMVRSVIVDVSR